ncbi:MAG: DUF192 domain-containing protein [Georgfuchsia sp.]
MKILLRTALGLLIFLSANIHAESFPEMELTMGIYRIEAEVAATDTTRQHGLMFREKMPSNHGMLFVFPEPRQVCMWMKNTLLPLSVAFFNDKGIIVNVEEMAPQTLNSHCSAGPIRFALEMNAGWFKQRGFAPGTALHGFERAPLPQ